MKKYAWCLLAVAAAGVVTADGYAQTAAADAAASARTDATTTAAARDALAAAPPRANDKSVVVSSNEDMFDDFATAVQREAQLSGYLRHLDPSERKQFVGSIADMRKLYHKFHRVDHMDAATKRRLRADQSMLNAITGEHLICRQERRLGSFLMQDDCTYTSRTAELQRAMQRTTSQPIMATHPHVR